MTAKRKGLIGAAVGAVTMVGFWFYNINNGTVERDFAELLGFVIAGVILGFGYTFGWYYVRSITAKMLGVAMVGSVLTIIFSRRDTFLKCVFIFGFALFSGVAIAYIPGIIRGIYLIYKEQTA